MKSLRGLRIGTRQMRPRLIALAAALLLVSVLGVGTALGKAETEKIQETIPFNITAHVPCAAGGAGEDVSLSGTLRDLVHFTENTQGDHIIRNLNIKATGIGQTTGDKYRFSDGTVQQANDAIEGAVVDTNLRSFRLIGQGPGNNLVAHLTVHRTVNANGELTADVDNVKVECK